LKLRELVRLSRVRERERGERLGCLLTRSQALLAVAVLSSSGDRQLWGLGDSSLSLSLSLCRRTSKEERVWKVLLWTVSLQLSSLMTSHSSFPQIPNSLSPFLSSNISFDFFTVTEEIAHGLQFYL
jgi:hypothetical protein